MLAVVAVAVCSSVIPYGIEQVVHGGAGRAALARLGAVAVDTETAYALAAGEVLGVTRADSTQAVSADTVYAAASLTKQLVRERVIKEKKRIDGRGVTDIRTLAAEVEAIPRVHGSALFERGETQILGVTTLDMLKMEQQLDTLSPEKHRRYMHKYVFPPFSTGETGRVGSPKRREVGHGGGRHPVLGDLADAGDELQRRAGVIPDGSREGDQLVRGGPGVGEHHPDAALQPGRPGGHLRTVEAAGDLRAGPRHQRDQRVHQPPVERRGDDGELFEGDVPFASSSSTPFLKCASILSASTPSGTPNERWNEP